MSTKDTHQQTQPALFADPRDLIDQLVRLRREIHDEYRRAVVNAKKIEELSAEVAEIQRELHPEHTEYPEVPKHA